MYALRLSQYSNFKSLAKADGRFVSFNGGTTDAREHAMLFDTEKKAETYGVEWFKGTEYRPEVFSLYIVQVVVKPMLISVREVVRTVV